VADYPTRVEYIYYNAEDVSNGTRQVQGWEETRLLLEGRWRSYPRPTIQIVLGGGILTKPKHSVRGASCDFLMDVAESIDMHGNSSDEGMLVRAATFLQDREIMKELP
jgi:hypothetical protein